MSCIVYKDVDSMSVQVSWIVGLELHALNMHNKLPEKRVTAAVKRVPVTVKEFIWSKTMGHNKGQQYEIRSDSEMKLS